ncbi:hypothetical protein FHT70_001219 [Rhizobium sp. BK049]|nr:hypothetical protein [Rhizobium sp. BK049]
MQIERFGGLAGLRDEGALESALGRPMHKANYGCDDVIELAAAYFFGLARNYAFVDGNKRIAIVRRCIPSRKWRDRDHRRQSLRFRPCHRRRRD